MEHDEAQELLDRLHAAQNGFHGGGDAGELRGLLAPDVVWHVPGHNPIAGTYRGYDDVLGYFARRRSLAAGTFRMTRRDVLAGDGATITAVTDREATLGGRTWRWGTVRLYRIVGGRIAECHLLPTDPEIFDWVWSHGEPPFIDELRVVARAPVAVVWRMLVTRFGRGQTGTRLLADLLGTRPRRALGTILGEGAAVPGFAVAEAIPERRLRLTGRHRFSRYSLVLYVEPGTDGTTLVARTFAAFPGPHGRLYRALVISSGAHRRVTTRLLRDIARQAERATGAPTP